MCVCGEEKGGGGGEEEGVGGKEDSVEQGEVSEVLHHPVMEILHVCDGLHQALKNIAGRAGECVCGEGGGGDGGGVGGRVDCVEQGEVSEVLHHPLMEILHVCDGVHQALKNSKVTMAS